MTDGAGVAVAAGAGLTEAPSPGRVVAAGVSVPWGHSDGAGEGVPEGAGVGEGGTSVLRLM